MSTTIEIPRFRFNERSMGSVEFNILDRDSEPVPVAGILTAELTLYDKDTGSNRVGISPQPGIINSRDSQDVLNVNNVTLSDTPTVGHVIWELEPEDNIIVTDRRQVERHMAMFFFTWSGGQHCFECEIDVNNLRLQA